MGLHSKKYDRQQWLYTHRNRVLIMADRLGMDAVDDYQDEFEALPKHKDDDSSKTCSN